MKQALNSGKEIFGIRIGPSNESNYDFGLVFRFIAYYKKRAGNKPCPINPGVRWQAERDTALDTVFGNPDKTH